MSFELVCQSCGAPSSAAVGTCPFCKSVQASQRAGKTGAVLAQLAKQYNEGNLEAALLLAEAATKEGSKHAEDCEVLLLAAKILLETEGPYGKIKGLLGKAFLISPDSTQISEYLDIINAKLELSVSSAQKGKETLLGVIRRNPENPHALFLLGAHFHWRENNSPEAFTYLQRCLQVRPQFLRAWACLAGVARVLQNQALACSALLKCLELEKNPTMRTFFERLLAELNDGKASPPPLKSRRSAA